MKEKIRFIDCGANIGQSIDWALNNFEEFEIKIDSFEANPELIGILNQKVSFIDEDITTHHVAVETTVDNKKFYLQTWGARTGSSLVKGKESTDENSFIETKTMDICNWIQENCSEEEFIALKLDIEGTEYKVVDALLTSGLYKSIDALLVEWTPDVKFVRNQEMTDSIEQRHQTIKDASEKFNLVLDWHDPEACIEPLRNLLNEKVKKH